MIIQLEQTDVLAAAGLWAFNIDSIGVIFARGFSLKVILSILGKSEGVRGFVQALVLLPRVVVLALKSTS